MAAMMTPRERVAAAVACRPVDRLPVDLGGSIVTGINALAYARLRAHLGLGGAGSRGRRPFRVTNIVLMLAEVERELVDRWALDVLPLPRYEAAPGVPLSGRLRRPWLRRHVDVHVSGRWRRHPLPGGREEALFPQGFRPVTRADGGWELFEGGVRTSLLSPGSGSFVPARFPLAGAGLEELQAYDPPAIREEELEYLHRTARRLFEETERALFGWFGGSLFEQAQFLLGFEELMLRLAADPPFVERLFARLADRVKADLRLYLQAAGPYLQVVGFADDFGFQEGLQLSPGLFRSTIKPKLRDIYALSHSLSPAGVFLHSCGAVAELIEDFIEIGVNALNPVQTSARGMEPERLARQFGGRICFWGGGADVQRVLPRGSPEEVRRDARRRIETLGGAGGFVFAPIHNLQADVPPENIAAMYEEAGRGRFG
jgi:uroporphyrinogen decarboxylase